MENRLHKCPNIGIDPVRLWKYNIIKYLVKMRQRWLHQTSSWITHFIRGSKKSPANALKLFPARKTSLEDSPIHQRKKTCAPAC
jgi:hypothetical protein